MWESIVESINRQTKEKIIFEFDQHELFGVILIELCFYFRFQFIHHFSGKRLHYNADKLQINTYLSSECSCRLVEQMQ